MRILCLGIQPRLLSAAATAAKSLQSCPTLCDPIDVSPPVSPVPGILQARTLEWVAISFSNAWQWKSESEVAQSCLTLSDPMDCSLPGSSVHGIFQARTLEWGAIAFSGLLSMDSQDLHFLLPHSCVLAEHSVKSSLQLGTHTLSSIISYLLKPLLETVSPL